MRQSDIRRVYDLLRYQLENYQKKDAIACRQTGRWISYSTQDLMSISDQLALGLYRMGIRRQDKIAIVSGNRVEWNLVDLAIQKVGAVSVPLYPTITVEDYRYILEHAECRMAFVENATLYEKVLACGYLQPDAVYTFDKIPGALHWLELKNIGEENFDAPSLSSIDKLIQADDVFSIIYTSGTTGSPKGVMLTHRNVVSNILAAINNLRLDFRHRALSFLPLCHIFERTLVWAYIYKGISVYYAESMDTIARDLQEVRPHVFTAVPRVLEKIYARLLQKARELEGLEKKLYLWALDLAKQYDTRQDKGRWYNLQLSVANNLIFSQWREALGANLKYIICGGAALNPVIARVFWAACIPVLEGYGMTETSPIITAGSPEKQDYCIGCVGEAITGVELKIAEDGEILVKGPNVMKGYYKDPEQTARIIDTDGWLHTGDVGELVEGKYLKITDRKKELFKTSGGKYISPQHIENQLKLSPLIAQAMVIGEGRKFPAAFIVPNWEAVDNWCRKNNLSGQDRALLLERAEIVDLFQKEVDQVNQQLAKYEQIKQFRLIPDEWTIEGGELTPTLKLKRKNILLKYKHLEEEIYKYYEEEVL